MGKGNEDLRQANKAKNDEFYTQLPDIENELKFYKDQFKGKTIFCNCDDPRESNFVKYFANNFEHLGLKKLIATHYKENTLFSSEKPYILEYTGDKNGNKMPDDEEFMYTAIGDGDFRSSESIALLQEADIVVTNPPFSLFREYVEQLVKYDKKFLIIGNQNAITYKEIFKLIKENKLWLGYGNFDNSRFFIPKEYYDGKSKYQEILDNGKVITRVSGVHWFTNLDVPKRHEELVLYKTYDPELYPKYDNYDAINVDKTSDIPIDYDGIMGVPITFLHKYNPEQFEIVKFRKGNDEKDLTFTKNDRQVYPYFRILIKKK